MLKIGVIGIGNCGNQIAKLAMKEAGCEVYAINTSENDLATLPADMPKRCIGDSEGSGKDRTEAKKFLKASIMEILREETFASFVAGKDAILVVSSTGGGTGSGIAPIMYDIIRTSVRSADGKSMITILVGVVPRMPEGLSTQENTVAYMHELFNVLDRPTYMLYDNNTYSRMSAPKVLEQVNRDIVNDIKVMQCRYNAPTPYDSIDEKDMKSALSCSGRIFMTSLMNIKEKDLDTATIESLLVERIKNTSHVELQRDRVVACSALITNLNPRLNEMFDTHIVGVREFVGEPMQELIHTVVVTERAVENSVHLILTGLSIPTDRYDRINERIEQILEDKRAAENIQKESSVFTVGSEDLSRLDQMRGDVSARKEMSKEGDFDVSPIFDKLM